MKRHRYATVLVACLITMVAVLVAHPVFASPPIEKGGFYEVINIIDDPNPQQVGQNLILNQTLEILNTVALEGPSVAEVRCVIHEQTNRGTCHGVEEFSGSVEGMAGTLTFNLVYTIDGDDLQGTFIITAGTGELANLHGVGTFEGGLTGTNSLQFHFDP